jgi:hypothetical protein
MAWPAVTPIDVDQSRWALAAHAVLDESARDYRLNRFREL